MFLRLILFVTLFLSVFSSHAARIVAVVNNSPITSIQFELRKQLLTSLDKIYKNSKPIEADKLNKVVLDMLVRETLMHEESKNASLVISDDEAKEAIARDEEGKKLPAGYMQKALSSYNSALYKDYMQHIKSQIIWARIVQEDVYPNIKIFPSEIDFLVIASNSKDMDLRFYELRSKNYSHLRGLKEKLGSLKEMKKVHSSSSLKIEEIATNLHSLNIDIQNIIKNLQIGDTSSIVRDGDEYRMFFVSERKHSNVSKQEMAFLQNFIANEKAGLLTKQASNFIKQRAFVSKMF